MYKYLFLGLTALMSVGCLTPIGPTEVKDWLDIDEKPVGTEVCPAVGDSCKHPEGFAGVCNSEFVCVICDGFEVDQKIGQNPENCFDNFCRKDDDNFATIHIEFNQGGGCITEDNKVGICNFLELGCVGVDDKP